MKLNTPGISAEEAGIYSITRAKAADAYMAYTAACDVAALANAEMDRATRMYLSAREASNDAYRDYIDALSEESSRTYTRWVSPR